MLENIMLNQSPSIEELASVMLIYSRKRCADYTEVQINNNPRLREQLTKAIMSDCKAAMPNVEDALWEKAAQRINQ